MTLSNHCTLWRAPKSIHLPVVHENRHDRQSISLLHEICDLVSACRKQFAPGLIEVHKPVLVRIAGQQVFGYG